MGTKTISISDSAYAALKNLKEGRESFTDVILKVARKDPLSQLVGILSPREAEDMRQVIRKMRRRADEEVKRTARKFNDT